MTEILDEPALTAVPSVKELVGPLLKRFQDEYNVGGSARIDLWNELCSDPDPSVSMTWDYHGVSRSIRIYRIADQLRLTGYAWTDGPDDRFWRRQDMGIVKHVGVPGIPWEDYLYESIKSAYGTLNTWDVSTLKERAPYVDDFSFEQLVIGSKLRPGFPIGMPSEQPRRLSSTFFLWAEAILSILAVVASIPDETAVRWALIVLFSLGQIYLLNRYSQTRRPRSARTRRR